MSENKTGYRGSKSVFNSVKEQRVDDNWCIKSKNISRMMQLRCILMGSEKNYQVKIPSKQLYAGKAKNFSTFNHSSGSAKATNPWILTGFIDAEGSFSVFIIKDTKRKLGWRIDPKFQLGLHIGDIYLLNHFQEILGGIGNIYSHPNKNMANFIINSKKDLAILINHLEKYPLLTQKGADFI